MVCLSATYALPDVGRASPGELQATPEQVSPNFMDVYWGAPGQSSLRSEGQTAYFRPCTDVYVNGHAWAAKGRKSAQTTVEVRLGQTRKVAIVTGQRFWMGSGMRPSAPDSFECVELRYENAFGGVSPHETGAWELRNPVGKGFCSSRKDAQDRELPNIEDPREPVRSWQDRPSPCSFGPVARSWMPRVKLAGTYDEAWQSSRAPWWPEDFDERFFAAASPGLTLVDPPYGMPVGLFGLAPDGPIVFTLPEMRYEVLCRLRDGQRTHPLKLDSVAIEVEERQVALIYRVGIPLPDGLAAHRESLVRAIR